MANEENRDYQLNQLSKRLREGSLRIIDSEIDQQSKLQNNGNIELLCVLKDIVNHASDVDFQQGKNHIFEAISGSEVMPQASASRSMSRANSEKTLRSNSPTRDSMSSEDNTGSPD